MNDLRTLLDARRAATAKPDGVFCHFQQGGVSVEICHRELWAGAARYANLLRQRNVTPGSVVVILLPHSPDLLYSFLGAMLAGAVPTFMPPPSSKQDPAHYWASHGRLFARLEPGAVLTDAANLAAIRGNLPEMEVPLLDQTDAQGMSAEFFSPEANPHDIAFLQHSSGTTGLKKGVALSHRAVLRQIASYRAALDLRADDRIVSWLPLYHDMGLIACFLLPLVTGTPVVMLDPFEWVVNPRLLFDAIKRHRGTLCWQPNFAFHHLCRTVRPATDLDVSSMRAWIDCSEPCRAESLQLFARTFAAAGVNAGQLQVCYAMAETVFAVTQTPLGGAPHVLRVDPEILRTDRRAHEVSADSAHQKIISTGPVVAGLNVRIVDEAGAVLADDVVGIIAIAGDFLFDGYYRLPDETSRKLRDGWYHTGDLGFLHAGELYVTGRAHDLIIIHGRNCYAHELEFLVNQVPGVHPGRNVAVGWFRPEIGSEELVIIAEVRAGSPPDLSGLAQTIKQAVLGETGLLVHDVHLVGPGWLVKTTSGKLSRGENLNKYLLARARASAA